MNLSEYILQSLVFIWIYSYIFVLGQYQLHSPIGSELSGMHCPDETVLVICDAHGEDMAIEWYIDNILLAQYVYDRDHQYPRNVTLEPNPVLNATVQISSATISENQYIFENFTLTTSSGNLLSHKNITCGVTAQRSNTFHIKNFTVRVEPIRKITYLVKYEGITGKLMKIEVYWIDELRFAMCKIITSYIVQLRDNEGVISTRLLSTDNCTNSRCYVQFNSSDWKNSIESEIFEVIVTAYNPWFSNTFASSTILNATGNVINLITCSTALISCSDLFNENCSINSTTSISPVILMPGETSLLSIDRDIEIRIQLNSTIFFTQANDIESCSNILLIATVPTILIVTLGIAIGIFIVACIICKRKINRKYEVKFVKVEFGIKQLMPINDNAQICNSCSQPYLYKVQEEVGGQVIYVDKYWIKYDCNLCNEKVCERCFTKKVYLKYCKEQKLVCDKCYDKYKAEKAMTELSERVGETKPPKVHRSKSCKECDGKIGQMTETGKAPIAKISACSSCGQWICNECFDDKEVELEYLNKKKKICKNCYAIRLMTTEDHKEESKL